MRISFFAIAVASLFTTEAQAQKKLKQAPVPVVQYEKGVTAADGKRVGKWEFYNRAAELELTFDYDSSRISYQRPDTTRYLVRVGKEWQLKRLARAPHFMGSSDERLFTLQRSLRYPLGAMSARQQGTVILAFTVDLNGHTSEYTIEQSGGKSLNEEVWRAVQTLPDNWIPAIFQGRPAATRFYLTVNFKLMSENEAQNFRSNIEQTSETSTGNTRIAATPTPHFKQEVVVVGFSQ